MHEFSIAADSVESVLAVAGARQAAQVQKVSLQIGELTCIEPEQLRFCYHSITKETLMENSTLEIEPVRAAVSCPHCSYAGPPKYWDGALSGPPVATLQCPTCGLAAEATEGHECGIKTVQFSR